MRAWCYPANCNVRFFVKPQCVKKRAAEKFQFVLLEPLMSSTRAISNFRLNTLVTNIQSIYHHQIQCIDVVMVTCEIKSYKRSGEGRLL